MNLLAMIAVAIAVIAIAITAGNLVMSARRDARARAGEEAVARAAYEFLAKHGISSRTIGTLLADGSMTLLIETAPHKKLRFSAVIEPSIRAYVKKIGGIEPAWVFWRFPIDEKADQAPEVRQTETATPVPPQGPAATEGGRPAPPKSADGLDDYLIHSHSYHLEEVSWNDFSHTVSEGQQPAEAPVKPAV